MNLHHEAIRDRVQRHLGVDLDSCVDIRVIALYHQHSGWILSSRRSNGVDKSLVKAVLDFCVFRGRWSIDSFDSDFVSASKE